MKIILSALILYLPVSFSSTAGRDLYFKECQKCHRKEGRNAGIITDVSGKSVKELTSELEKFKNGKRIPVLFAPIKKTMSDKQIKSVAEYMSKMDE